MRSTLLLSLLLALGGLQQAAPDIDLTAVVPKTRTREPMTGTSSGGSVGLGGGAAVAKDFAQIVLLSLEPSTEPEPHVTFEVQVRNDGPVALEFPVDPNLGDFEPKSASVSYSYESAYIALFADLKERGSLFLPGISLFGSVGTNGSFKTLNPGDSIRIRGRVDLRPIGTHSAETIPSGAQIRATLLLQRAFVSQRDGKLDQKSEQIMPQIASSNLISFLPPQ